MEAAISKTDRNIAPESAFLAAMCMADMLSTLWLVYAHGAREANPIMAFYLALGPLVFALAKTLTFMSPIVVLEMLRKRRPQFIRSVLRTAIVCYLVCYGFGIWQVNSHRSPEESSDTTIESASVQ